jgi:exopolysaccharide production protein ExoQ
MTTTAHTFESDSLGSALGGQAFAWQFNRRVFLAAAFVGFMFFISDHGWLISRYEDYAGTSEYMQTVTSEGNISRQASIFALGLASAIVLARSVGYRFRLTSPLAMLIIATALWCIASMMWSIEPGIAARRLIATGCVAVCALAAARILKPVELAAGALLCCVSYLIIGFLTEIALGTFRPWLASHRFAGTLHPNLQGLNCALLVMAAVYLGWHTVRYRQAMWAFAVLGLIGMWLAKSRTPLISLVAAEAIF